MDAPTAFYQTSPHSPRYLLILSPPSSSSFFFAAVYQTSPHSPCLSIKSFLAFFHPNHENIQAILVIEEYRNRELFGYIHTYITSELLPSVGGVVKITKPKHSNTLIWGVGQDQEIADNFRGVPLKWVMRAKQENGLIGRFRKSRYFELCVPKKHLAEVRSLYPQSHVLEEAARIRRNNMILRQQQQRRRNDGCVGWVNVIAGLLIQLIGCC